VQSVRCSDGKLRAVEFHPASPARLLKKPFNPDDLLREMSSLSVIRRRNMTASMLGQVAAQRAWRGTKVWLALRRQVYVRHRSGRAMKSGAPA
jgi:hypothetical protein